MTKEERLKLIKQRAEALTPQFGEIMPSDVDVDEELHNIDGFREFERDEHSTRLALNSDEL